MSRSVFILKPVNKGATELGEEHIRKIQIVGPTL
jgi:hypothetical protein